MISQLQQHQAVPQERYVDGVEYFKELLEDISKSRKSIDFEVYIFDLDKTGLRFVQALSEASKRGVRVRLLVDGAGSAFFSGLEVRKLQDAGVQVRVYHALPWNLTQLGISGKSWGFGKLWYSLGKINKRNHRKTVMLDGEVIWLGSFNITDWHLPGFLGGGGFRDSAIRINNVDYSEVKKAFELAWSHKKLWKRILKTFKRRGDQSSLGKFRLNHSRSRRKKSLSTMIYKIKNSHRRIWIKNAYFLPHPKLLKSLKDAAFRGVDVKLILPSKSDVMFFPWVSSSFYLNLLSSGVCIYEYLPAPLHSKEFIADDYFSIGSSNLNQRSFYHDLELDYSLQSDTQKSLMESAYLKDLEDSRKVELSKINLRDKVKMLFGRFMLVFRYWI